MGPLLANGEISLCSEGHGEKCCPGHQNVLARIPEVWEEVDIHSQLHLKNFYQRIVPNSWYIMIYHLAHNNRKDKRTWYLQILFYTYKNIKGINDGQPDEKMVKVWAHFWLSAIEKITLSFLSNFILKKVLWLCIWTWEHERQPHYQQVLETPPLEFPILRSNTESRKTKNMQMFFCVSVVPESTCWTSCSFWQTSHSSDIIDLRLSVGFCLSSEPVSFWTVTGNPSPYSPLLRALSMFLLLFVPTFAHTISRI